MKALSPGKARLAILAAGVAAIGMGFHLHREQQSPGESSSVPSTLVNGEQATSRPVAEPRDAELSQKASSRESDALNFRKQSNNDGTTDEFRRSADRKLMTRTIRSATGAMESQVIYHLNDEGKVLNGEIFDAKGTKIAKANYGYSNKPGVLEGKMVEEQIFDAQEPRYSANAGEEMPVRRLIYTYNADGSQNEPFAVVLSSGNDVGATHAKSDGLPWMKPSALSSNPFADLDPAAAR
ncbi:MAG: hypothetical protein JWO82_2826 [Akkermansiaceae bacterium]|nr:hypothetical protein [Akkermansiaceae bacterium]